MRKSTRGNSTLEFTLVGIPLIFTLISIFEMSRGMWNYHTMAHSIKEGTRYAVVHGDNCAPHPPLNNNCQVTIGQIVQVIKDAGIGLDQDQLTLTFTSASNGAVTCTLTNCLANNAVWPAYPDNIGGLPIEIDGKIRFDSALAMFWPGVTHGINFATAYFPATSQELMEF